MARILIVDDEVAIRKALERFLVGMDYDVFTAVDGESALAILEKEAINLALVDLVMPKIDGVELIRQMKRMQPDIVPIVLTGFGTITSAVEAMKAGAYHYLTKPFELDDIASLIATALEHSQLKEENRLLKKQVHEKYQYKNFIGSSDEIAKVFDLIERVSESDSTVLITGESGTGKELVAKAIHYSGPRCEKPLITVNCAAIPEDLLESELFGHVKGSFTGAVSTRMGKFDAADKGTIFLDEIGDMSSKLQVKVLRVIQEQRFDPIGSSNTHQVDVRIIAATNRNLESDVKNGLFREDLYYRLNVIPIQVPPLRKRKSDIPLLLRYFMDKNAQLTGRNIDDIESNALELLSHYPWPGNVRELENTVERILILKSGGSICKADLPVHLIEQATLPSNHKKINSHDYPSIPDKGLSFKDAVDEFERNLIVEALKQTKGNKNQAANLLKLNRTTLVEKIKKKKMEIVL